MCETVSPETQQNYGWLYNAGGSSNSAPSVNIDYSATRFLEDLQKGCQAIGAPFDKETTKAVLEAYEDHFNEGAIQLRTTSRPGDPLFYRLFTRHPINAIETAVKRGFLSPQKEIAPLINAWNSKWDDTYEQLDFASDGGVASAFLYLGVPKHINDLLFGVSNVPESIKSVKPKFDDFGLERVQAVLADYNSNKIAFYFIATGPLTKDLAANFCALAGCPPPSDELYSDMSTTLGSDPFFFMVSMDFKTGKIGEVQFYILFPVEVRGDSLPKVGDRLTTYWNVESYEEEEMDILGWCFPSNSEPYLQADRGYCGGLRNILRDWKLIDDGDKSGYLHS